MTFDAPEILGGVRKCICIPYHHCILSIYIIYLPGSLDWGLIIIIIIIMIMMMITTIISISPLPI